MEKAQRVAGTMLTLLIGVCMIPLFAVAFLRDKLTECKEAEEVVGVDDMPPKYDDEYFMGNGSRD